MDELDVHVAREAHRNRDIGRRVAAAVFRIVAGKVLQQKPRTDFDFLDPGAHRRPHVRHDVGHLDDAIVGLTEAY